MTRIMIDEVKGESNDIPDEKLRYYNDVFRLATQPMTSIAERGFMLKVIDNLFKAGYYRHKQSAYVTK